MNSEATVVILACEGGHVQTYKPFENAREELEENEDPFSSYSNYCSDCGSETIHYCRSCGIVLTDEVPFAEVLLAEPEAVTLPEYCSNCGEAHPWADSMEHQEGGFADSKTDATQGLELDQKLQQKAVAALERGEPEDAVRAAGIILDDRVDDVVSDSVSDGRDGSDLMAAALGPDGGEIEIAEHGSEQAGIMLLAQGLMQAFRNPFSHRTREEGRGKYLDDITEQDAMTAILLSDFLIRKMEGAESS
jgi:hypothetical protein